MDALLITARAVHFGAAISLAGIFGFSCLVGEPAMRRARLDHEARTRLHRKLQRLAWASLALALASGVGWLTASAATMSGQPLVAVLSQGLLATVLTQTRFGEDWLLRLGLAALLAICAASRRPEWLRWPALALAAAMLASLAWAGHGAATPGAPGELHLGGDILHLLGAGLWLGTLVPFELLLAEAAHAGEPAWPNGARLAARRYTVLGFASVAVLLLGGIVNTWFLAGTVPALIGTDYGRLLLVKIALFLAMLLVASVNLLRLSPRLDGARPALPTIAQLRRNAWIETALGIGVVGVVAVLGTMPPGLHSEPGWPLPFRLDFAELSPVATAAAALAAIACCSCALAAVAVVAAGRYRRIAPLGAAILLCAAAAWVPLRPGLEPAYPTSFYASPEPFSAPSVVRGAALYAANCAVCHGPDGHGDGPAASSLPIRPADLTEAHLFAHNPGDLFWWITNGRKQGVMPGFAAVMKPDERWDVINFIRARAAGVLARQTGPEVTEAAAYPVPDFAFETDGGQSTLRRALSSGPVLLVLFTGSPPIARLEQLAAARPELAKAGLRAIAVSLDGEPNGPAGSALPVVDVGSTVRSAVALYRSAADGGETELLLDRNGDIRARWTAVAGRLPDATNLTVDGERAAQFGVAAPSHAGHGG